MAGVSPIPVGIGVIVDIPSQVGQSKSMTGILLAVSEKSSAKWSVSRATGSGVVHMKRSRQAVIGIERHVGSTGLEHSE